MALRGRGAQGSEHVEGNGSHKSWQVAGGTEGVGEFVGRGRERLTEPLWFQLSGTCQWVLRSPGPG